jgi:hypothetical protein
MSRRDRTGEPTLRAPAARSAARRRSRSERIDAALTPSKAAIRRHDILTALVLAVVCLLPPRVANAQPETGGIASLGTSAAFGGEATEVSITGALGYRVTPTLAITLELTALPDLTPKLPEAPDYFIARATPLIYPTPFPSYSAEGGHGTFVTGNLRLELPAQGRVRPYLLAGAGAGTVVERVRTRFSYPVIPLAELIAIGLVPPASVVPALPPQSFEEVIQTSFTGLTATFGGGFGFRLSETFTLDVDLRYLALLGQGDRHLARLGAGLTARF